MRIDVLDGDCRQGAARMGKDGQQLQAIMEQHPALHNGGYGGKPSVNTQENRDALAGSVEAFARVRDWVAANLQPIKGTNRRRSSYGMKHIAESEIGYITNGVFIAAMLANGYRMDPNPGYNPSFNVSEDALKTVESRLTWRAM